MKYLKIVLRVDESKLEEARRSLGMLENKEIGPWPAPTPGELVPLHEHSVEVFSEDAGEEGGRVIKDFGPPGLTITGFIPVLVSIQVDGKEPVDLLLIGLSAPSPQRDEEVRNPGKVH